MQFPLPLAILDAGGEVQLLNERFSQLFDGGELALGASSNRLAEIALSPAPSRQSIRLTRKDGTAVAARAHSVTVPGGLMLVIDDALQDARDGMAAELVQLRTRVTELEKTTSTDYLTGIWNRAHLDRMIEIEIRRSTRFRQPVSLILLDIDHFKRINDTYGHQTGDVVLRTLAETVHSGIRAADMLFRWGGEEFVVLTASTGHRKARVLAESLRALVDMHEFPAVGHVTVSLGVAEYTDGESAEDWFRRLDDALYSAKNGGRNCVFENLRGNSNSWSAEGSASPLRLVWQESYECGEQSIDHEHRRLFDLANALIDASFEREAHPEHFEQRLEILMGHLSAHFEHEERILAAHGYLHLEAHRRAHANLLARAVELKENVQAGDVTIGELTEFLASTIVSRHLFAADREYFPLFASKAG